ncbi:hypothetical protein EVAR_72082_1 [Eumeta japonica]|uniref:YqaJ viral recombinase domain-containing protein n=1 Tax=Eumeta variegata TaxID=151549 RepID=A0A4C1SS73_EUMVA|nr:hypothetical protein EVAR_72082_1 [Eumeta japonica]
MWTHRLANRRRRCTLRDNGSDRELAGNFGEGLPERGSIQDLRCRSESAPTLWLGGSDAFAISRLSRHNFPQNIRLRFLPYKATNLLPGRVLGKCHVQPEPVVRALTHRRCVRYNHYNVHRCGLSNFNEFASSMNLPILNNSLCSKCHENLYNWWKATAESTMKAAAVEETDKATETTKDGASPDAVFSDGIIETKCPKSAFGLHPDDAIKEKKIRMWKIIKKNVVLNKSHDWYYQVQGQLHITKKIIFICSVDWV